MQHRLTRRLLLGGAAAIPATTFLNASANAGSPPAAGPPDLSTRLLSEWAEAPGAHP